MSELPVEKSIAPFDVVVNADPEPSIATVVAMRAVCAAPVVRIEASTIFVPDRGVVAGVVLPGADFGVELPPHAPSVKVNAAAAAIPTIETRRVVRFRMSPPWSESAHIVSRAIHRTRSGRP
jgi:hypothetical protein